MNKTKKFKWIIEIEVDEVWVADGYDPDEDQLTFAIMDSMLGFANDDELKIKILERPSDLSVSLAQGYKSVKAYRKASWKGSRRI